MTTKGPREWSPRSEMKRFVRDHGISMESQPVPMNPAFEGDPWADTAYHYAIKFKKGRKKLVTWFSMGSANVDPPTTEEVLSSLADDAAGYENNPSLEFWIREYGSPEGEEVDPDSPEARKEKRLFQLVKKSSEKLKEFLGEEAYKQLLWEVERE